MSAIVLFAYSGARGQHAVDLNPSCFLIGFLKLESRMSGDNNFLQAVHFCFISIFEGGLFYVVNGKWVEN
jgi:hypothetical protein